MGYCLITWFISHDTWVGNERKWRRDHPNILRIGLQMSQIWRLQKSWPLWECRQTWLRRDLSSFWGWNMVKHGETYGNPPKKITQIHRTNRTATSILRKCEFLHLFEWYIGPHFMLMSGWKSIRQLFWYEHQGARCMIYNVHCLWYFILLWHVVV